MRIALLACVLAAAACGSTPRKADAPGGAASASASAAPPPDNPARVLTKDECTSLAGWVGEACHDRSNLDRSTRAEGWCADVAGTEESERRWIADCAAHVRVADEACMRSSHKVRDMMSCDEAVDRSR